MYYCMTINQLAIVNKYQMRCNNKNICFETIYKIYLLFLKEQGTRQYIHFNSFCDACCKNDFCYWLKTAFF